MRNQNLHILPNVRDRFSFLYVEHARIDQEAKSIAIQNKDGTTPVPCANLMLLMLGPGTRITHSAVLALADNGCFVVWCGEEGVRFYASGQGITRNAERLLVQASLCSRRSTRLKVVRRMYGLRFEDTLSDNLTLQQIRGREGARVRDAYARSALQYGIEWKGRHYKRDAWASADPANRALSAANSCLYGICHAAIVAAGYAPGLGFIHIGKQLSFVYDVADFYKADIAVPIAFELATSVEKNLEREVRRATRDAFAKSKLLEQIVHDIDYVLQVAPEADDLPEEMDFDADPAKPGDLWDPEQGNVAGGENYGTQDEVEGEQPDGHNDT